MLSTFQLISEMRAGKVLFATNTLHFLATELPLCSGDLQQQTIKKTIKHLQQ